MHYLINYICKYILIFFFLEMLLLNVMSQIVAWAYRKSGSLRILWALAFFHCLLSFKLGMLWFFSELMLYSVVLFDTFLLRWSMLRFMTCHVKKKNCAVKYIITQTFLYYTKPQPAIFKLVVTKPGLSKNDDERPINFPIHHLYHKQAISFFTHTK